MADVNNANGSSFLYCFRSSFYFVVLGLIQEGKF